MSTSAEIWMAAALSPTSPPPTRFLPAWEMSSVYQGNEDTMNEENETGNSDCVSSSNKETSVFTSDDEINNKICALNSKQSACLKYLCIGVSR